MVINECCVRAVLIELQKKLNLQFHDGKCGFQGISIYDLINAMPEYSKEDIWYSIYNVASCNYIEGINIRGMNHGRLDDQIITNITIIGQKFIESIKSETVWDKTEAIINKVGNHTFGFIESVALDVAVEISKEAVADISRV